MVNVDAPEPGRRSGPASRTSGAGPSARRRVGIGASGRARVRSGPSPARSGLGRRVGRAQRSGSGSCADAGIGPVAGRARRPSRGSMTGSRRRGRGGRGRPRWRRGGDPAGRVTAARQGARSAAGDLATLEVLAAPGAQRPVHPDQPAAVRADALQAGPAGRADDPFVVDPALAGRAVVDRLDLGEERLLGQVPLPDLADLLVRPDDLVDPDGEDEEDRGEQDDAGGRDVRQDRVVRPLLHVAERPVGASPAR